jgi:hypothetical protein
VLLSPTKFVDFHLNDAQNKILMLGQALTSRASETAKGDKLDLLISRAQETARNDELTLERERTRENPRFLDSVATEAALDCTVDFDTQLDYCVLSAQSIGCHATEVVLDTYLNASMFNTDGEL